MLGEDFGIDMGWCSGFNRFFRVVGDFPVSPWKSTWNEYKQLSNNDPLETAQAS